MIAIDSRDHVQDYSNRVPAFGTAPQALLQGLAAMHDVEVHVVSCLHRSLASPDKIAPNISYHGLPVSKLGWMRSLYFGCSRAVRKKLVEIKPDIVHGQGTELHCALSAVRSDLPNVVTIHGNMKHLAVVLRARVASYHWLAARLEDTALKRTDGVFCNSAYTERLVAPRALKTWRVPNAVRLEFLAPVPVREQTGRPLLLNIGMIQPHKRQLELLQVARNLQARGFKFELQFVGDLNARSDYGAAFSREITRMQNSGFVSHVGLLLGQQLIAKIDAAAALVHFPSEESFGLAVAEALTRNLKIFGAAIGGVVDIVEGVEGVELVPANDLAALEEALARWFKAGCPLPRNASGPMRERYHPEVVARRHLEIYREVLGQPNSNLE